MSTTIPGTVRRHVVVEGAVSRGARDGDFLQGVAAGSGAADVDEQSGPGGGGESAGIGGVRRDGQGGAELGVLSRDCAIAEGVGDGRDVAGAVGEAGGGFSDARICAAGAAVQFESGGALEQLGPVSRTGSRRADDVRADDRGKLDLHRHAGNFAGDVRDVCGGGGEAFWRQRWRGNWW